MSDINKVILIGRLTRDAELKYTASGQAVGNFSLAVDRRVKSGDGWVNEASFFDVTLWGKTAEALSKYLTKGKQVAIDGELKQDRWQQDGQNRSKVVVIAQNVLLLGGGQGGAAGKPSGDEPAKAGGGAGGDGFTDDVPF